MTIAEMREMRDIGTVELDGTRFRDGRFGRDARRVLIARAPELPATAPLIVELHGSGLTAEHQLRCSGLHRRARAHGFAIAAPQAHTPLRLFAQLPAGFAWNIPGAPLVGHDAITDAAPDDLAFVRDVIDAIAPAATRVFLVGFSGGARLCSWLAFTLAARVAGVATVAGLRFPDELAAAAPAGPPPLLACHGTLDTVNPFAGSANARWTASVADTAAAYARAFAWTARADDAIAPHVRRQAFVDTADRTRLLQYVVDGGSHTWPGSRDVQHRRLFGEPTRELDATAAIWEFFAPLVSAT